MSISIRAKIVLAQIFLVTLVSAFIYTYYPKQQENAEMQSIDDKIIAIANMFSIGVGIGMGETDLVAVSEALNWAKTDRSVIYISVEGTNNEPIALYNPQNIKLPKDIRYSAAESQTVAKQNILFFKAPIEYESRRLGTLMIAYSLSKLQDHIATIRHTTLFFCLGLFGVGVMISVMVGKMISSNIVKLNKAVYAISTGQEGVRIEINSKDEIGRLGTAFNSMLDKIDRSHEELLNYSNQLKKQNDELNQFSYVVSHDLKAPLRAIFQLSEWIEEDAGNTISGEAKGNLQMMRGRIFRMEALINGLLEYARIGRVNITPERTQVKEVIRDVVDLLAPKPPFKITIQENMPVLNTKKILLQQVFLNLISNAIKFNDKKEPEVTVDAKQSGAFILFSVADNGVGIDRRYHQKIFTIFQTLEARDKVEGTGVGLSIVKKIIDEVGGTIQIYSIPDKGTTFVFGWPVSIENHVKQTAKYGYTS